MSASRPEPSRALRPYLWSVPAAAALGVVVSAVFGLPRPSFARVGIGVLCAASVAVLESRPVRVSPNQKVSLASVPLLIGCFLLPAPEAALVGGVGIFAGNLLVKRNARNSLFNAGTAAIGCLVASAIAWPFRATIAGVTRATVATLLFLLVTPILPATAGALQHRTLPLKQVAILYRLLWAQGLAMSAIAIAFVFFLLTVPLAAILPLLVLPLVYQMNRLVEAQLTASEHVRRLLENERRFLTDVSHHLGNPLTTIRTNLSLARSEPLSASQSTALTDAEDEALHLVELFRRLRVLAMTDEELPLNMERLDLGAIASDLVRAYASTARDKGVGLKVETAASVEIRADRELLRQAAANLVDNALRHTPPGKSVSISVSSAAGHAILDVADEGTGIQPEALPKIFDRFSKGPAGGSGLGLAISRNVVERHGGEITVASAPGLGSRFRISLPLAN